MELEKLVVRFRAVLESTTPLNFSGTSLSVSQFPNACCDDASQLLAAFLTDHGYPGAILLRGESGGKAGELNSHVWLKLNGLDIDITADQFNKYGYSNPRILINKNNEFLSTFDVTNNGLADFRQHLLKYNDAGLMREFTSCYKIISTLVGDGA